MPLTNEQIKSLDSLNEERQYLYVLRTLPGWKLVAAEFQKVSDFAYGVMAKTDNPHMAAKQMGAWHVAESVIAYPERRLSEIDKIVNLIERQAAARQG